MHFYPQHCSKCFGFHSQKCWVSCFIWINTCPPINLLLIFTFTSRYCVNFKWGSHVWSCWYHLNIFKFVNYHFLRNGCNNCGLGKGRIILRATFYKVFFPLVTKVFGCTHQHDDFFHRCVNMRWLVNDFISLPLLV